MQVESCYLQTLALDFARVHFVMLINKAQGQCLKIAGLDLQVPCFSHGVDPRWRMVGSFAARSSAAAYSRTPTPLDRGLIQRPKAGKVWFRFVDARGRSSRQPFCTSLYRYRLAEKPAFGRPLCPAPNDGDLEKESRGWPGDTSVSDVHSCVHAIYMEDHCRQITDSCNK